MWMQGSTYSQPWHQDEVGWLVLRSAAFTPGESPRYSFYRRLSGPQDQSGYKSMKKISTPLTPGIKLGPSSPQPSALPLEQPGPQVFEYDPETKHQSMEWHTQSSLRPFFYSQRIIHKEFVSPCQGVNQHLLRGSERLSKRVMHMRSNIKNNWVLHLDHVPCHTAISVNRFLANKNIPVVPQPHHSSDLSPCDFFSF